MGCCISLIKEVNAYKAIMAVNYVILLFGVIMMGFGIYALSTYGDDSFFSKQIYVLQVIFGMMTVGLVALACIGAKEPQEKPNYLFCYWCLVSILLVGNLAGFMYFKTFRSGLNSLNNGDDRDGVFGVVQTQLAKEFQDFLLSTYTACCTGCNIDLVPECEANLTSDANTGEEFCPEPILEAGAGGLENGQCIFARVCSLEVLQAQFEASGVNDGLGLGCFTSLEKIPGFGVASDSCAVFQELDHNGAGLVGPVTNGKSCGGGDPVEYVNDVVDYFNDHYYMFAVPWGMLIGLLLVAWLASVFLILFHSSGRNVQDYRR